MRGRKAGGYFARSHTRGRRKGAKVRAKESDMGGGGGEAKGTEERLAGCSRRSNFQNGSSSIKQVLLSLLQRASSTNPSQNVRRMPPPMDGRGRGARKGEIAPSQISSTSTSRGPENRCADLPGLARLSSIFCLSFTPPRPSLSRHRPPKTRKSEGAFSRSNAEPSAAITNPWRELWLAPRV